MNDKSENKLNNKLEDNAETLIVIALMAIVSFIFLLNSPLHPWITSESNVDSSVFKTVAMMMDRGFMPYQDSFDHKGPLLYILEWVGLKINFYNGTWYVEFIFMATFLTMTYKTARLVTGKVISFIVTLSSLAFLTRYFAGGNLTEEYSLMFTAISLFIFLDFFLNEKINRFRLMAIGFCFACAFLLRPNLIAVWVAFIFVILIKSLLTKDWSNLLTYILFFSIGALIITIPIALWLIVNGCLSDCIYAFITFNMKYSSSNGERASFISKLSSFLYFGRQPLPLISVLSSMILCLFQKNKRLLNITYLLFIIIDLYFTCMGGVTHEHYAIILVPVFAYPLAALIRQLLDLTDKKKTIQKVLSLAISCLLIFTLIIPSFKGLVISLPDTYRDRKTAHFSPIAIEVRDLICSRTNENDSISVYGNYDIIYLLTKRPHATRYSFQYPISGVDPAIADEYFAQLSEEMPKIIAVVDMYCNDDRINNFLNSNNYSSIYNLEGLLSIYYRE